MVGRLRCWFRSRLFHKLVLSHVLLLAFFLCLALMMGRYAFRAFSHLLFQENFIRQSNLLFHGLVDELQHAERSAAHLKKAHAGNKAGHHHHKHTHKHRHAPKAVGVVHQRPTSARVVAIPASRPTSRRTVLRPTSRPVFPSLVPRKTPGRKSPPPSRRRIVSLVHGGQGAPATEAKVLIPGNRWPLWKPVLHRHTHSASRFLVTLVAVLRPDGSCIFETYPPTLMGVMLDRKWPRRYGWKRLLRSPEIKLSHARKGRCDKMERLQSLRHGKVYQVAEHKLFVGSKAFLRVRYHSLSPFRDRPPTGAILLPVIFVFGLAVLLVFPISRNITRSLRGLMESVQKIQAGDLTQEVAVTGADEVGQLAYAVEDMRSSLLAHQEQRRALLSDVSHEIRTPLARVRTVAESVADGLMREEQALTGAMEGICQQVDEIDQLLGDILDLARFGLSKANQLQRSSLSLRELLEEMSRALRPSAEAQGKELQLVLPEESLGTLTLEGDRRRLRQVVNNLIQNAVRYSPNGGKIQLSLGTSGPTRVGGDGAPRSAWIFVSDEGPGVPLADRERIFERLVRLDPSRCRHTGGQGLGLSIVSQIVLAHDGEVGVDDAPGGGARFWVRLPMA